MASFSGADQDAFDAIMADINASAPDHKGNFDMDQDNFVDAHEHQHQPDTMMDANLAM